MKVVEKKERKSNAKSRVDTVMKLINAEYDSEGRIALIQELIPLGLMAVEEILQTEVRELAGIRYRRDENPNKRWGSNIGSVHLGNQKHNIRVPRVRNQRNGQEVPLKSYQAFQSDQGVNEHMLAQVING